MNASRFIKGDYRRHGPLVSKPLTMDYIGEKTGDNRHERRRAKHFKGIRKNTLGVPQGFNVTTWNTRCQDIAAIQCNRDASKGRPYVSPGKQKRYASPDDFLKGVPCTRILHRMIRKQGLQKTLLMMHGRKA